MSDHCGCWWNSETGYFEACSEKHEQEYVEYLERQREAHAPSGGPAVVLVGTRVYCTVCGHQKQPRGRSAPMELRMCDWECSGYDQDPHVGQLWPGEKSEDFGYPVRPYGSDIPAHAPNGAAASNEGEPHA